jgi:hypothetical protein
VTRTLVRGLRRLEALTPHARGVSFFSSRDCAPLRVDRGRVTEKTGNVSPVVRDRSNIGFASVNRANDVESSTVSRSTIPCRDGDTLRAREETDGGTRANADMRRSRRDTSRRGNAFVSRCSLLCLSIALIVSSARLVSGQRWVRAWIKEAMLVSSRQCAALARFVRAHTSRVHA